MDPLVIVDRLEQQSLIEDQQAKVLRTYYAHHLVTLHVELRLLLWLGSGMFVSGLGLLVRDSISDVIITGAILASIGGCFWGAQSTHIHHLIRAGLVSMACSLMIVLRAQLEYHYGLFEGEFRLSSLTLAAIFFAVAYLYDHRGVLIMATTSLTAFVGAVVDPEASFFLVEESDVELLPLLAGYSLAALFAVYLLKKKQIGRDFTVPYLYFYANLLLSVATLGYLKFDFHFGYFMLLLTSCIGLGFASVAVRRSAVLVFALFYFYVAITSYTFENFELEIVGGMTYFILTGSAFIGLILAVRNRFRGLHVS